MRRIYLDKSEKIFLMIEDVVDPATGETTLTRSSVWRVEADDGAWWQEWKYNTHSFDVMMGQGREAHPDEVPDHLKDQM